MTESSGAAASGNLFDMLGEDGLQWQRRQEQKPAEEDGPNATDGAKKKAEELKVDLAEVKGSGKGGRIVAGDVQKVATERVREKQRQKAAAGNKEPDVYDKDRVVLYAGHRIEVPTREMKLEEVRSELLEEQFPELSKERTEMLYDEEQGHIIPVLKGHRKGAVTSGQPLAVHTAIPEDHHRRPVFHVLGEDGVYQVRTTQVGTFIARVEADLPAREGARLRVPEIPAALFNEVVAGFRAAPNTEHMANICYSRVGSHHGNGYFVSWPDQLGAETTVTADGTVETEDRFVVLQVHSHGRLPAFFSPTDDADEVRTGLYGVVGRCDRERPEAAFRFSCGGIYRPLHPFEIFDDPDELAVSLVEGPGGEVEHHRV